MQPFTPTTVYVVHQSFSHGSALGSAWRVENSAPDVIALGSSCDGVSIVQGDPFTGIWVSYGECRVTPFVICSLTYMKTTAETIPGCYNLNVRAFPGRSAPLTIDCDGIDRSIGAGFFTFDLYDAKRFQCVDCVSATEQSTWGSVKALYR
jgi:hypothetical protein